MDNARINGDLTYYPTIFSKTLGREKQTSQLIYNLGFGIAQKKNPKETLALGTLAGGVIINKNGAYEYDHTESNVSMFVKNVGTVPGFDSSFKGRIIGKPPLNDSRVGQAIRYAKKQTNGKTVSIAIKKWDNMLFEDVSLPAGPILKNYPAARVNGEMTYDYDRFLWVLKITASYTLEGQKVTDRISGTIQWVKSPDYDTNHESEYQFDIRFNEPETTGEEALFKPLADEDAFFAVDTSVPCITGSMKYVDTMRGETVVKSMITVKLFGRNITKQQAMLTTKVIEIACAKPVNDE